MRSPRPLFIVFFFFIISNSLRAQFNYPVHRQDTSLFNIKTTEAGGITLWPLPANSTGIVTKADQFDLNHDGKNEILVCIGIRDTSIYASAIYSPDSNGKYKCVLQPGYWGKIEVGPTQPDGWQQLIVHGEPYFKVMALQDNQVLLDFIEPRPISYVFQNTRFIRKDEEKKNYTSQVASPQKAETELY